jgi:hypothetical protein
MDPELVTTIAQVAVGLPARGARRLREAEPRRAGRPRPAKHPHL